MSAFPIVNRTFETSAETEDGFDSPEFRIFLQVWYTLVCIVGVAGNLLTIVSILVYKKLKSIPNVYICNLAIVDLIVCAIVAPFNAWSTTNDPRSLAGACEAIGAISIGLLGTTMISLTAIAFNRYVLIVRGSQLYRRIYTRRNVVISVILVWMAGVAIIIPGLVGFGSYGYNAPFGSCAMRGRDHMTYYMVQSILHGLCVGPAIIITVICYGCIIHHFREIKRRIRKNNTSVIVHETSKEAWKRQSENSTEEAELSSSGPSNNNSGQTAAQARTSKKQRASQRIVMNLCTVFATFLICWTPIVAVYTIDFHSKAPYVVVKAFYAIAISNSCLNVFIYAGMNSSFRSSYKQIITCSCKKNDL